MASDFSISNAGAGAAPRARKPANLRESFSSCVHPGRCWVMPPGSRRAAAFCLLVTFSNHVGPDLPPAQT